MNYDIQNAWGKEAVVASCFFLPSHTCVSFGTERHFEICFGPFEKKKLKGVSGMGLQEFLTAAATSVIDSVRAVNSVLPARARVPVWLSLIGGSAAYIATRKPSPSK